MNLEVNHERMKIALFRQYKRVYEKMKREQNAFARLADSEYQGYCYDRDLRFVRRLRRWE